MLTYALNGKNKYYSLYESIRGDILRGAVKAGEKLPGKRALAENLGVSVITVQTAYEQLLAEGYIRSEERRGYFVEEVTGQFRAARAPEEDVCAEEERFDIDFVKGSTPAEQFPFSVWARLMRSTLSEEGEHLLERVPADGDARLKMAVSDYLYRCRGVEVPARRIIIGAGAEYLYGVIIQLLGRDGVYALENPTYGKIPAAYSLYGAKTLHVPVGAQGVEADAVEKSRARALHISPAHQYPTGAVTPAANRARLINWAKETGAYIIEDDYDSEFRTFGKPLQTMLAMDGDRVIYLNTFSKTLAPSLRMGYMVLPPELYERFTRIFAGGASAVPLFEQRTLAKMLSGGHFERHVNRLRHYYRGIRELLLGYARGLNVRQEIRDGGGGLHMTVKFPGAPSDGYIKERAKEFGINLKCLSDYLCSPLGGFERTAVINYSGVTEEQLKTLFNKLYMEYNR